MKRITFLIFFVFLFQACGFYQNKKVSQDKLINTITEQLSYFPEIKDTLNLKTSSRVFPRTLTPSGKLQLVGKRDWTSGFYPGVLWSMYNLTGELKWKEQAELYTSILESEQFNASNHDLGFKMMPSFGEGYKVTKNEKYKDVLIQSAKTLITRFDEKIGCIKSWDHNKDKWDFPVIIDNLMNLELLFWAWKETGDSVFYNIANTHAKTTMKHHFRNDYSSYHVVGYDMETGGVVSKNTHQGYADDSSWARGQAWALYGFTMIYRETKDPIYLTQAENVANYILNIAKLPEDYVPYWDFDVKNIEAEPRDASAAAVIASAFFELSGYSEENSKTYISTANHILTSLSSEKYFNTKGANKGFLLKHSTGSKPKDSEIDVPLIYADYYYLEALLRRSKLNNQTITKN
ncbi:glycoside hydrolase family 88 protein [Mariniflexile sp. AS56]|uniref:glycoside hydrolase family 88 protein n=1 Tax=Mariniflexile sp. AS56 TaxID=3063957 RepID=UPI0026ED0D5F|nr:glycoside hydrolase family 88 protein [Mariniflexile sp. AS56]MDO7174024.1 glycoside hydrolase family 88 protein [Mariniflexile sp. AS56]